jgi:hypothetical protein
VTVLPTDVGSGGNSFMSSSMIEEQLLVSSLGASEETWSGTQSVFKGVNMTLFIDLRSCGNSFRSSMRIGGAMADIRNKNNKLKKLSDYIYIIKID